MSWASAYIAALAEGRTVSFRPRGDSMTPRIRSGQLVTLEPISDFAALAEGDVVLARVAGRHFLHLVSARDETRVRISNNHGHINGWANRSAVYGKLIRVEE